MAAVTSGALGEPDNKMPIADDAVSTAFQPLYGRPCWQAKRGYSSFLTFEFGEPRLDIHEPKQLPYDLTPKKRMPIERRPVAVHGQWLLWIYCCAWSIRLHGSQIAHSESAEWRIDRAIGALDGQALTRVTVDPLSAKTCFEFDLGGVLHTWPNDERGEQWLLYEPSGYALAIRADGQYAHQPADAAPAEEEWRPLLALVSFRYKECAWQRALR